MLVLTEEQFKNLEEMLRKQNDNYQPPMKLLLKSKILLKG